MVSFCKGMLLESHLDLVFSKKHSRESQLGNLNLTDNSLMLWYLDLILLKKTFWLKLENSDSKKYSRELNIWNLEKWIQGINFKPFSSKLRKWFIKLVSKLISKFPILKTVLLILKTS